MILSVRTHRYRRPCLPAYLVSRRQKLISKSPGKQDSELESLEIHKFLGNPWGIFGEPIQNPLGILKNPCESFDINLKLIEMIGFFHYHEIL